MYMHQNEYSFINVVQGSNEQHLIDVGPVPGFHHKFQIYQNASYEHNVLQKVQSSTKSIYFWIMCVGYVLL